MSNEDFELIGWLRSRNAIVASLLCSSFAGIIGALGIVIIEVLLGQMESDRLMLFGRTVVAACCSCFVVGLLFPKRFVVAILLLSAVFGWLWWHLRIRQPGLDAVIPWELQLLFAGHYPFAALLSALFYRQFAKSVGFHGSKWVQEA